MGHRQRRKKLQNMLYQDKNLEKRYKSKSPAEHVEIAEELMAEAATFWQQNDMENSLKKAKEALDYLNASVGPNHRKSLQAKQMYQTALEKYNSE